jgi:hypothetical protein
MSNESVFVKLTITIYPESLTLPTIYGETVFDLRKEGSSIERPWSCSLWLTNNGSAFFLRKT